MPSRLLQTKTVLIAEDEPAVREALACLLEYEGYRVIDCPDGAAAMAAMAERLPDLVVSDYMMPTMSGLELAIEMKASRTLCDVPVVLVSGAHAALAQRNAKLFAAIMEKPYRLDGLLALIARLTRKASGPETGTDRDGTLIRSGQLAR